MAYTVQNYKTKRAVVEDFKAGKKIKCFQPGDIFELKPGKVSLKGPHYPEPHKWYLSVVIDNDGYIESIVGVKKS